MMATTTLDEIAEFVQRHTGYRDPVGPDTALQRDIGVFGDDMAEFLDAYASRFQVDVSEHLWYFHTGEEGWNVGGVFFKPPHARVSEIPITVRMLHEFANRGWWAIDYPEHRLLKRRYDLWINLAVVGLLALAAGGFLAAGWLG